jgi:hypothetical protein
VGAASTAPDATSGIFFLWRRSDGGCVELSTTEGGALSDLFLFSGRATVDRPDRRGGVESVAMVLEVVEKDMVGSR